ncbi:MAG: hypothetical protein H6696_05085 [Deferribacteres bacterium]|nr:hypothetical protein [candidate division KSB1 bacterium]MCB9501291.1 hypothetical protein [Deferribacteres bacterium]
MQKFILYYIVPGSILLVMALVFSGFLPAIPQPSNVQHSQDYRLGDVEMHFLNLLANVQKNLPSKEDSLQSDFQQNIIREDPFKKPDLSNTAFLSKWQEGYGELQLQGILWDVSGSRAVIDEKVVKTGDHLGMYDIVAITPQTVVLQKMHEHVVLRLDRKTSEFTE